MRKETTPASINEMLSGLCHDLNPDTPPLWVKVIPEKWAIQNECFPNVQEKIRKDGGSCVNGWAIWQWANMLITAEAHSVWQGDEDVLVDITPHNHNENKILFVPDSNVIFEGVVIPNKYAPMTSSPKISYLIDLLLTRNHIIEQSGTCTTYSMPVPLLEEIQSILRDITKRASPNDLCPCGSGLKYKKCCGPYDR